MARRYDVLIIGGGVIGTAIAARLSQTSARVCLVEKTGDVAEGASKGNAGITSSYYAAPGTIEAKLTTASVFRWDEVCRKLNVPFKRIGALMPALNEIEAEALTKEMDLALRCGVRAEILSGAEARRREPLITPACLTALYLPDEGIIDPMRLTWAFAELAARNGAELFFDAPVTSFRTNNDRIVAALTPRETIEADFFINAAGLHADVISKLAGGDAFRMWPRKGQ
jgi:glycerol-3-phosphate dehydrogenase